jgi:hypothetical protein
VTGGAMEPDIRWREHFQIVRERGPEMRVVAQVLGRERAEELAAWMTEADVGHPYCAVYTVRRVPPWVRATRRSWGA